MKTIALAVAASLLLAGCVSHTWAPPPGGSSVTFEQQSAQCRLFARGITPSGGFVAASGKPAFVGAFVGGALIGSAIGNAVATQNNFNDCMSASGWLIADHQPTPIAHLQPASAEAPLPGSQVQAGKPVPSFCSDPSVTNPYLRAECPPVRIPSSQATD